jgi:hypothetical protein
MPPRDPRSRFFPRARPGSVRKQHTAGDSIIPANVAVTIGSHPRTRVGHIDTDDDRLSFRLVRHDRSPLADKILVSGVEQNDQVLSLRLLKVWVEFRDAVWLTVADLPAHNFVARAVRPPQGHFDEEPSARRVRAAYGLLSTGW